MRLLSLQMWLLAVALLCAAACGDTAGSTGPVVSDAALDAADAAVAETAVDSGVLDAPAADVEVLNTDTEVAGTDAVDEGAEVADVESAEIADDAADVTVTMDEVTGIDVQDGADASPPAPTTLCDPCNSNADCQKLGDKNALCVPQGSLGSFCGMGCDLSAESDTCPVNFKCQAVGTGGVAQCQILGDASCASCSAQATQDGASTACGVTNTAGTCPGKRACTSAGLSACDAVTPLPETCNGADENCNGLTDEGFSDIDGDGVADCVDMDIDGDGVVNAADCSPTNAAINPGATELCNGVDDDCDGLTDDAYDAPGCTVYFGDKDGDGFGVGGGVCLCGPSGVLSALKAGDCDPQNEKIHPGASEFCNGVDDNCDGITDVGAVDCSNWYTDSDGDGFGSGAATCACEAPSNVVSNSGDCNDASAAISPKAVESCDGIDNNCDGATDEAGAKGCTNFHADADGDGYGDPAKVACLCAASGVFTVINSQDCDDTQAAAFFGAVEACDGVDNNCDGVTDEAGATGCVTYFKDGDGDGFGGGFGLCLCQANATYAFTDNSDCNDANAGIHPGAAESCGVIDHDCNGLVNEPGAGGCLAYARDHDGDGYGLAGDTTCLCVPAGEYTTTDTSDCDDNAKAVHPMAAEICNGVDDNCDGVTDPTGAGGCYTVYTDGDADGFGGNVTGVCLCTYGAGYSSVHTDCNDADASVHPGVTESCNGKDDNCDGVTDPANSANCVSYYEDDDTDGYGQSGKKQCTCLSGAPFTATVAGDCNDAASAINPGANEVCNGVDDNCNGQIDEGLLKTWYIDADQDGYGTGVGAASCTGDSSHTVTVGGDCDDTSNAIHPLALEVCNFVDDDCNGQTDDGLAATLWYVDNDNDGYGGASSASLCKANATYKVATSGDCNDTNSAIHPGATDICDGIDNNCSGQADEGLATFSYYHDGDGDTYGAGAASFQCGPYGTHTVLSNSDCNDANSAVHPGATEICGDGIDNNCNAQVDEGCAVCTASTLQDFESGVGTGWALSTYWYVATWLPVTGTYALTFGDPSLCGYPVETNYATSANFTIPTGAKYLKLSLRLVNYYACSSYDISYNCIGTHTIDSTAKIVLKLGTTTQTFGPYGYYNGGTQTVTWAIDPSQWGTTVNLSAAFTSAWGSTDCLGGAAIDDVRITCN